MQNKSAVVAKSSSRTDSPTDYLGQGWFPINGTHLQEIKKKLAAGAFKDNRRALIEELKKDFGLLSYCLKSLRGSEVFADNPLKLLEVAPLDELASVLMKSEGDITPHSFNDILKPQALRFRHSTISCVTAEALAEKAGIDAELAYSCALVRQLGLNLVAWNYPRIYSKAITTIADGHEDLEAVLFKNLGFSPRQVGVSLSVRNLTPDLKIGLGLEPVTDPNSMGGQLARFCEISEAFAQINDPEYYPAVTRRWKGVIQDLGHYLGPKALSVLRERMDGYAMNYAALPHKMIDTELSIEKSLEIANKKFSESLFNENSSASKVPEELQSRLKRVYSLVRPGQVSPEALQALISECIPVAGFNRGCVYLLEPGSQTLIPKLRIGDRALEQYKSIQGTAIISSDNPILEALQSSVPVKRDGAVLFGERVSLVSGVIGNTDKTGVLYLEMNDELSQDGGFEPVLRFRAIRHCLNQCLNLAQNSPN